MFARTLVRRSIARRSLSVGDLLPLVALFEGSPGNAVLLAAETAKGKHLIVTVPGAFSPACSALHVPGYLQALPALANKGIDSVFVVSVNDPFVMKSWGELLGSGIRYLADLTGAFGKEADMLFDATKIFGQPRWKRGAIVVDKGVVTGLWVEPDNVSVDVSAASKVVNEV